VDGFQPLKGWPALPLDSVSFSLDLGAAGAPATLGLLSFKVRGKLRVSAENASSSGVFDLLADLATVECSRALAY
jgi:hypothetical protein